MAPHLPTPRTSPHRPVRWLHQLSDLLSQAAVAERSAGSSPSLADRRFQQRVAVARRLLDPLPVALRSPDRQAEQFWVALRWGSLGLLLALLLRS